MPLHNTGFRPLLQFWGDSRIVLNSRWLRSRRGFTTRNDAPLKLAFLLDHLTGSDLILSPSDFSIACYSMRTWVSGPAGCCHSAPHPGNVHFVLGVSLYKKRSSAEILYFDFLRWFNLHYKATIAHTVILDLLNSWWAPFSVLRWSRHRILVKSPLCHVMLSSELWTEEYLPVAAMLLLLVTGKHILLLILLLCDLDITDLYISGWRTRKKEMSGGLSRTGVMMLSVDMTRSWLSPRFFPDLLHLSWRYLPEASKDKRQMRPGW